MRPEGVVAVLTAAGFSRRMGQAKGLLDWGGQPLIAHQVAMLAICREVILVVGPGAEPLLAALPSLENLRVVVNAEPELGRSHSLRLGFEAVPTGVEGILVAAVDQPIAPGVVAALLADVRPGTMYTVPRCAERDGHPVLFAGALLDELRAIDEASEGLRAVVNRHRAARQTVAFADAAVLWDLNDPRDYRAACETRRHAEAARNRPLPGDSAV